MTSSPSGSARVGPRAASPKDGGMVQGTRAGPSVTGET